MDKSGLWKMAPIQASETNASLSDSFHWLQHYDEWTQFCPAIFKSGGQCCFRWVLDGRKSVLHVPPLGSSFNERG
ncbi:hypothetical protein CCGE525_30235 (plasmid) [Rhizobium jaguaris]|uniref:Uncharacterized protein n=1 Tax=Rhizobium jaguaris TaxID=1312183 RepID=A0A387FX89_9HYPH|nr:hypothetical protein CCGE525_30235 [Rhizobium jaguaris]